jgi:hypothetical protein
MTKYYSVTEDELTQIKNDCYYPSVLSCDDCEFEDDHIGCNWKGANRLEDEILERVDPLDVLEKWSGAINDALDYGYYEPTVFVSELNEMIERLKENPQEVVKEGIKEGWWKICSTPST